MKSIGLLLFIVGWILNGFGQEIDSLLNALSDPSNSNLKHELYLAIASQYLDTNLDSSLVYVERSIIEAQRSNSGYLLGKSYYQKGIVSRQRAEFDQSIQSFQLALKQFEAEDKTIDEGRVCNSLALTYKRMGDVQKVRPFTEKALEYAKKAVIFFEMNKDTANWANALNTLGIIYRDLNLFDQAEAAYIKGLALFESQPLQFRVGILYANLGQIYMDYYKNYESAIQHFERALQVYLPLHYLNGQEHAYRNLSEAHRLQGSISKAIEYGNQSIELADSLHDSHRIFNAQMVLAKAYEAANDYANALEHFKISKQMEDSTLRVEKSRIVSEIETKYDTERKELEIANLNEKNASQRRQLILGSIGLLLLLFLSILLYRQYQKVNQSREKITRQSEQLKILMKELHHRVKNNLAIVSSLLKIQSARIEDEQALEAVRQGQQRVEAMSLIHQRLYQADKVTSINIKEYITDLTESLMSAYGYRSDHFDLNLNIQAEELDVDIAIPIALILNELITNSFKYAYPEVKRPSLQIDLSAHNELTLEVQDNGPGIDMTLWDGSRKSFGKKLIKGLSRQLGGVIHMENRNGTYCRLTIPKENLKLVAS